jgi:hypothetical protein
MAVFALTCFISGCGIITTEIFTINPDLSGKCAISIRMPLDTSSLGAKLASKDSMYGITPSYIDFHKKKFSRNDVMEFALKILRTRGVEEWSAIRFGMTKKKDLLYFGGVAYFRDISKVRFSMIDSVLQVTHELGNKTTLKIEPTLPPVKPIPADTVNKKVDELMKNAFYIRPVLANLLDHTETNIIFTLPGRIVNSAIFETEGDSILTLELTGNEILKYADSLAKNKDLATREYVSTNGTCANVLEPLFNRIAYGTGVPIEVTFNNNHKNLFDYNEEVQRAMVYFDDFKAQSKLEKFDSTEASKEEKAESKRPVEYGRLMVNKVDSTAGKVYFADMTGIQKNDTITFSGELSQGIKVDAGKIHIQKLIANADEDITDSIADKNKITLELTSEDGSKDPKVSKRKVKFVLITDFPPGCKEVAVQGRLSTTVSGKPGPQIPFKMKQIAVSLKAATATSAIHRQ